MSERVIHIALDMDEAKNCEIANINQFHSLTELVENVKEQLAIQSIDSSGYGFFTKTDQLLVASIEDIQNMQGANGIKMENLILRDLKEEAKANTKELQKMTSKLKKEKKNIGKIEESKESRYVEVITRVLNNIEANNDFFQRKYVEADGVKDIMLLIMECQDAQAYQIIHTLTKMLAFLLKWDFAVINIKNKTQKYFTKFMDLADINDEIHKQVLKIIFNCASRLPESFDVILQTVKEHSEKKKTQPFNSLLQTLESQDES